MKKLIEKLFTMIPCEFCEGVGWRQGGNYSWKCKHCFDGKVYKYSFLLKTMAIAFIGSFIAFLVFILQTFGL